MRYTIRLSYNGSGFNGWQIQSNAASVQECLQTALSTLLGENVQVVGAGRTDTEVNAINYIAHFETTRAISLDAETLCYKINAITPAEMCVHKLDGATDDFHARFDAKEREYKYFIHRSKDPFISKFSYLYTFDLDIEAMNKAAALLLGTKDFSCFEKVGGNNKTSICTVMDAHWSTYVPGHVQMLGYPAGEDQYLVFTIRADRFLRNMVRAIVGTMLEIGRGKRSPESITGLIAGKNRSSAGQSVPGYGLFLSEIKY